MKKKQTRKKKVVKKVTLKGKPVVKKSAPRKAVARKSVRQPTQRKKVRKVVRSSNELKQLMLKAALESTKPGIPMREDPEVLKHRAREDAACLRSGQGRVEYPDVPFVLVPGKSRSKRKCGVPKGTRKVRIKSVDKPTTYRVAMTLDGLRTHLRSSPTEDKDYVVGRMQKLKDMYPEKVWPNREIVLV